MPPPRIATLRRMLKRHTESPKTVPTTLSQEREESQAFITIAEQWIEDRQLIWVTEGLVYKNDRAKRFGRVVFQPQDPKPWVAEMGFRHGAEAFHTQKEAVERLEWRAVEEGLEIEDD